ncbi:MAG: phytanoyl-CoA dioxygenase family protein [Zavarzinia sp.]|nr:phytanoyl-CoA dioxygenase family protein [Zavarzinia sp.]
MLSLPFQILAIGTGAKSFVGNPVLGSRLLNRLGLHVLRLVVADRVMAFRRLLLAATVPAADRATLHRDGFVVKTDFLPAADFAALEAEIRALKAPARECHQGDTITHRVLLDEETLASLPAARRLLADRRYRRLLGYVAGRLRVPGQWVQEIRSGILPGAPDPQLNLHVDTFQPTMKAWLFLDDVAEDEGPFTYVPGSNRLNLARLAYEYRRSLDERHSPDVLSARGSLRVPEADLPVLGLPPARALAVRRNTLVIADTRGLHRRGDLRVRPSTRLEIWSMCRTNPFNPLPGLPFRWCDRLDLALYRAWLRDQDRRAAKQGGNPAWRLVLPAKDR